MSLSVFCATRAEPHTPPFFHAMLDLARRCSGKLYLIADGDAAFDRLVNNGPLTAAHLILAGADGVHRTVQRVIDRDRSDYVMCLDDDERCTQKLADWIADGGYVAADFWRIARAWLYGDASHYISSRKHWPNHAIRIARRDLATVNLNPIHAGWFTGDGIYANTPYALEHHKFLIRSLEYREAEVDLREHHTPGSGMYKQYLPERLMVDVAVWEG